MKFSENLKFLRKEFGFTARELSQKLNCSNNLIYDWEHNRCEPSFSVLCLLSDIFNCSIDYLLGREDDLGNVVISNGVKPGLEPGEEELIKNFRQLNMYQRDAISLQAKILAEDNLKVIKK